MKGYVYLFRSQTTKWCKIGYSIDPSERVKQLEREIPGLNWIEVARIWSEDCRRLERAMHAVFASRRVVRNKEWFFLGDAEAEMFKALSFRDDHSADAEEAPIVEAEEPAAASEFYDPQEPVLRFEGGKGATWAQVVAQLKQDGRALTASVFAEASRVECSHRTVRVYFPTDLAFYAQMADAFQHRRAMQDAIRKLCYWQTRVEVKVES